MERIFKQFNNIQSTAPKELVREYQTPDGTKVREVGPIVYGYSMTVGPDGKPHISQFGNVKNFSGGLNEQELNLTGMGSGPALSAEREPLADVNTTDKEIKVIVEMPGIKKEDIKINTTEGIVKSRLPVLKENIIKPWNYHQKQISIRLGLTTTMEY